MPRLFLLIVFALLLSSLINCALAPPDTPVCTELDMSRGWCTYTISGKEFFVDDENLFEGKTWWDMRPTMLQIPAQSWVEIKTFIIKTCKKHKCSKEISSWERTVGTIDKQINLKGKQ